MPADEIKALAHRIIEEVFNQRKPEVLDEVIASDYVEHAPLPPDWPKGRAALRQAAITALDAFPDFHYTVEDEIVEGDKIVLRVTARGTQRGQFLGIPPTDKSASWSEIHIGRAAGGKFVEHWATSDQLGMMQQLGAIPESAPAGG